MKRILTVLFLMVFLCANAQINLEEKGVDPIYFKFLPSNVDPYNLKPSDIPSKQVLLQMGLSKKEVKEILDFKNGEGKYALDNDTTSEYQLKLLYNNFGDTVTILDSVKYPKAKIYGQDIFRNNQLKFYNKALDAKAPENYKVGSGDEISISIWGYSEFSETLEVDERGYINPSSYGRIYVKGLTFKKMRSLLKSRFSAFLDMKNSEIDVTLSYSRVITVNIVGEVYLPGSYTIPAINTAFNALIASKGPTQIGSVRNIYIKRNGQLVDSLDVYEFLYNPKESRDVYMQDGDYLVVPPARNLIEIKGAVNRPYTYEFKHNESVYDMISYAGGYTRNAFKDVITHKKIEYNTIKVYDVQKKDLNSTLVDNGDEIIINSISNKLSNVVSLKGSIGVPGDYEFVKGEKLLNFLERTKCIDKNTFLEKVYIIRLNQDRTRSHISINLKEILKNKNYKDNIELNEYDVIYVLSLDDFDDVFSVSITGAIRKSGDYEYGYGMTLQDLLIKARGLTQYAEGSRVEVSRIMNYEIESNQLNPIRAIVKKINIGKDLLLNQEAKDFTLEPFDQIFVRTNPDFEPVRNIVLTGEVKYPGTYALINKDEKISSVIKRAGGFTNYAFLGGGRMYRRFQNSLENDKNELNIIEISDELKNSIMDNDYLSEIYKKEKKKIAIEKQRSKLDVFINNDIDYTYDAVYLDLNKALSEHSNKHDIVLIDGDSIIIPRTMDMVQITGDLMNLDGRSISAPYFIGRRANYYINNFAGGYTKENDRSNTVVIYANGITRKSINLGLFTISPKVKKGSKIRVASKDIRKKIKKDPIDWNQQIENAMVKVTAILTLWLLIDKVDQTQQ